MTACEPIAVIGIGCIFPRANNRGAYWANIRNGVDAITEIPEGHWRVDDYYSPDPSLQDHTHAKRGGFLSAMDFAPFEFGIPPNAIEATDTSQLLGMCAAKQALEDAGYGDASRYDKDRVSVILGVTGALELTTTLGARLGHPKWRKALRDEGLDDALSDAVIKRISEQYVPWQENSFPGLLGNVVAGRISNYLDLGGTNCVVDAACASSFSAIHLASMELQTGRADMVISGGIDTFNDVFMYMCFGKTLALSPTSDAKPFDEDADGTILGEGLGIVVLKRLEDAQRDRDTIYAVIRAMGTSSDGKGKAIYAPSEKGQIKAIRQAYGSARIDPSTITLLEAHGTGTKVGDAVEINAISSVFNNGTSAPWCAIGSVKSQIGHTKAAAGVAGLIKAALALHHKVLPPTIKVTRPTRALRENSPFYINQAPKPWVSHPGHPRRAAVSAFGFGGSNFHCVLEEYDAVKAAPDFDGATEILAVSAHTLEKLKKELDRIHAGSSREELLSLFKKLRGGFDVRNRYRLTAVVREGDDVDGLMTRIGKTLEREGHDHSWSLPEGVYFGSGEPEGKLGFLFPGQGSQYVGMLREMSCQFPQMLASLETADLALGEKMGEKSGRKTLVSDSIYPPHPFTEDEKKSREAALRSTDVAQPAIGAVSAGLFKVLSSFGVAPDVVAGHSYGELTALFAAERVDEKVFFDISVLRGTLMNTGKSDRGGMLAVMGKVGMVEAVLSETGLDIVIANKNAPNQVVLSGDKPDLEKIKGVFETRKIRCMSLPVADAFHSRAVSHAADAFLSGLEKASFSKGKIPVFSNTTGKKYPAAPAAARKRLAYQLAKPVDFMSVIENMHAEGVRTFVEVGPNAVLTGLVKAILGTRAHVCLATDKASSKESGIAGFARVLAHLSAAGYAVDLTPWNLNLKEPAVLNKPKMTVPISGVNHVAERGPTPPKPRTSKPRTSEPGASFISHEEKPMGHTITEPGAQSAPGAEAKKTNMMPALAHQSLDHLQAGMVALQKIQEQTARLHEKFLEGQNAATHMLADLLGRSQPASTPERPSGERTQEPVRTERVEIPVPEKQLLSELPLTAEDPGEDRCQASPCKPAETPELHPEISNAAQAHVQKILLEAVSETTGYPVEMLEPDMTLDSDLGIDSIKRVEIFSVLREKLPDAPEIEAKHLGELETLQHIMDHLAATGAARDQGVTPPTVAGPTVAGPPVVAPPPDPEGRSEIVKTLLTAVSETTGYPVEMLELDMTLDNDLGIDSIKRVEIFSVLREKLPDAPEIEAKHLGELETLQHIVDHLTRVLPGPGAGKDDREGADRETLKPPPHVSHIPPIFRSVVSCEAIETASSKGIRVSKAGPIWITRDEDGLCTALQDRLQRMGHETSVISLEDPDGPKPPDALSGLVILGRKDADDGFILNAFKLLRIAEKGLRKRADDGIKRLVTVTFMDGRFGFGDPSREISPTQGGLAGLSKTAGHEWPEVACLALDMGEFGDPLESASAIVSEMFKTGPVERGLSKDHRITLQLVPGPLQTPESRTLLDPDDVVIVSGGARGITAEVAAAVARAWAPVIILLGRSPVPGEGSRRFDHLKTESEIKRAIMAGGSGNMTPKTLEKEFRKVMADREIDNTLKRLTDLGSKVQYHRVDIRNRAQVRDVLAAVRDEFGRITAVIHGAGVLEDRLIGDKTALQFETVYATKVMGLRSLLDATEGDPLKMLALFSSSSARFGRKGQIDYAAANEVLNKMAREEARKRPHCRTVAVNWGPWNGGMVTRALKPLFEAEGIDLIEKEAGADYFVNELGSGEKGPVEVVVMGGAFKEDAFSDNVPQSGLKEPLGPGASSFELDLTLDGYPILKDHVMNGNAVLPAAVMIEWLAHGALRNSPEYRFVGFDDFRVFKGIVMENGDSRHLQITAAHLSGNNGTVSLLAEIRGVNGSPGGSPGDPLPVLHASAKVVLSNKMPVNGAGRIPLEGLESYPPGNGNFYNDILFHGKRLQNILSAQRRGDDVIMVDLSPTASPAAWMHGGTQDRWVADPGAIDGAFQAMILWSFQQCNMGSLPNRIGKYRQFKDRFPSKGVRAAARVKERSGHRAVADIEFTDKISGDVVARMEDYECTLDASLNGAFKRRKLA